MQPLHAHGSNIDDIPFASSRSDLELDDSFDVLDDEDEDEDAEDEDEDEDFDDDLDDDFGGLMVDDEEEDE